MAKLHIKFDEDEAAPPTNTQLESTETARQKGKKRSAAEAFKPQSKDTSQAKDKPHIKAFSDTLKHHRSSTAKIGGSGVAQSKVVNFSDTNNHDDIVDHHGEGNNLEGQTTQQLNNRHSNLKERARQLLSTRQQLPIYSHADHIRQNLREHDVLLLVGETGSGKSTQIPQFLVNEAWCRRQKTKGKGSVGGCIAITQPRRVAAISLARRVAEEMGTPLGNSSPASQVGYSVRFENSTSPSTRIKFLTEGMLLQEMLRDPWLKEYSAVVVDEVHERGVNVDLVLGFLRRMHDLRSKDDGRGGVPMKVVVMSATADMEKISGFFNGQQQQLLQPEQGVDKSIEEKKASLKDKAADATKTLAVNGAKTESQKQKSQHRATSLFIKGRQHPVTINYTPSPVPDILDAAYERIMHIHSHSPLPGDILVFLTGQETVESLMSLVTNWATSIQKDPKLSRQLPKLLVLPLYAALPSHMQQRVFQPTPKFTRKIILATNIAETSITVPGVRYVIDTGKAKQRLFRPSLNLDTLLTVPISRSSANQRSGRAGRDAPGTAYRLYTESDFYRLPQDTEPEILRCDLSQLVLTLKAHGIDDLLGFPFLTSPPRRALERAMIHLVQLTALDTTTGKITPLGRDMSGLPLPASLARVLLASAEPEFDCVDEIVDIVSALSVENVFLNIHRNQSDGLQNDNNRRGEGDGDGDVDADAENETREARAERYRRVLFRREGDHLTLLATMQACAAEQSDRRRWCEERFISHRAMSSAMDVRKQLTALMAQRMKKTTNRGKREGKGEKSGDGDGKENGTVVSDVDVSCHDPTTLPARILKCILTGFHANVARLSPDGSYRTVLTNQPVAIHPSSVLFSAGGGGGGGPKKFEGIVYNEFVYTGTKAYARGVSAVEMRWLGEILNRSSK
ncbi:Salivary acidic proline-rich phosphoprotein 1/2 [Exophiala dermatitidis]|uniref:RNA helicase n=1 Tax=Exophiala dermatitidis TaxID=5970 RepID=A0AAN6EXG9_EXODE|nr:Salivary acidic proline-rich phosphoprotein 1/2 [Exophiala dermatitidis]KAJ4516965.1 Salivary acidic proline-rich phosphoprotein 1/2 [Exophiala dermatitidis]KAJ4519856.1 Salivary acidic proline-rich phosphoprotein 1/2 [Exophiala dermatitidis]KAJ4534335.1 Salivary acidic proline-rich phosphoprotein 1/2 [Exophiala dermatitidis]KAJ4541443.1 Salivary acidic proline-rich phosphoprotein 1/2 [Exophiala dermatitidis]